MTAQLYYELKMQQPRYQEEKRLVRFGRKLFSDNDKDGIIREIFNCIATTDKTDIEFGVQARENNTLALLADGWQGTRLKRSQTV